MYTVYFGRYLTEMSDFETAREAKAYARLLISYRERVYITRESKSHPAGQTSQYCGITKLVRCDTNNGHSTNHVCEVI